MRALFSVFPLLVIPVAIYAIMALTTGGVDPDTVVSGERVVAPLADKLNAGLLNLNMISGVEWRLTNADMLILLALAFLFLEILKSTSTGTATIMNHAISMVLFIACLILFLLSQNFATSTFFILTIMTLLDVLAGVVVTIVSARRDFAVGEGFGG
ncbi:MAG: hypothetical protein AAFR33_10510 [Pseudomonadota bacterium]